MFETEEKLKLVYQDKGKFYPFLKMLEKLANEEKIPEKLSKENITDIQRND